MAGPAVKQQRRKVSTKSKVTTPSQHVSSSISNFTRVSKSIAKTDVKKEEPIVTLTPKKDANLEALTPASRKRKVVASIEEDDSSADETPTKASFPAIKPAKTVSQLAKRGRGRPSKKARPEPTAELTTEPTTTEPATTKLATAKLATISTKPATKKRARSPTVSDSDESAIDTGALFKKLRLESSPSRCSTPLTAATSIADSDAEVDTDFTPKKIVSQLPNEVLALVDLHSSFLKTLTLHYAHNGSNVPVDLRVLCPNVARAWGKKKVTEADIRICLGVLNLAPNNTTQTNNNKPLFSLSNYGRGKICIEIDLAQHGSGRPLDEAKLNDTFRTNISSLWSRFSASNGPNASSFIATALPKAPVIVCESIAKAAPVLAKGQKRLEELKHGIAVKKQEKEQAKAQQIAQQQAQKQKQGDTQMANTAAPKMSLLDRLRLKSLQKSNMPGVTGNLTPAQMARRAALQRAPEVAATLGMLSRASAGGGGRVSFTMAAALEKIRDSFRMGISREEGATCLRLLAQEVAPEWVRVVKLAGREHVVVETDCEVSQVGVEARVRAILEKE
ncbi:hypothetical protein F5Y04DRAFT_242910 [Hypomontagnella monticulosa]|nr:hypothetical protein F5Y04DRAFT_242910 [Hypomontagnella monticulosa]